jgi:FkbM family methyltransferase
MKPTHPIKIFLATLRTYMRNILAKKEEDESPYLSSILQKDDICLHIGATDGRHSFAMARALKGGNGYILAFEPSPITFPVMKNAVRLHGLAKKIFPERKAFSDKAQTLTLNVPVKTTGRAANNFGFTSKPGEKVIGRNGEQNPEILSFTVEATTIDDVAAKCPRVDFIRMDIEGSERLALNGGWKTIEKFRPHLLIEIHPKLLREKFGADPQDIYRDFKNLGYRIYHLDDARLVESPDLDIAPWKDYFFINPDRPHDLKAA